MVDDDGRRTMGGGAIAVCAATMMSRLDDGPAMTIAIAFLDRVPSYFLEQVTREGACVLP